MGMFGVAPGTEVKIIRHGVEWYTRNFEDYVTEKQAWFFKEQLLVDPTGVSKSVHVHTPRYKPHVVGDNWANAGWFGFEMWKEEGFGVPCDTYYAAMVPGSQVTYA
jgi:hypothetical protein